MDLTDKVHPQTGVTQICSRPLNNLAIQKFMPELGPSVERKILLFRSRHAKQ
jgi:hypothetical protein